jgi:hypothetical protein
MRIDEATLRADAVPDHVDSARVYAKQLSADFLTAE